MTMKDTCLSLSLKNNILKQNTYYVFCFKIPTGGFSGESAILEILRKVCLQHSAEDAVEEGG